MTDEEIRKIAEPILMERFKIYGFGRFVVNSGRDFDGDMIHRVMVDVDTRVPIGELIRATADITQSLGDDGLVFINARTPDDIEADAESDEEMAE